VQAEILALLRELQAAFGLALLLISHDLDVVAQVCEEVLVMYAGRVVESGPTPRLLTSPRHPYSAGLLAARPRLDTPPGEPLRPVPGQPPDPGRLPPGCAFAPRCHRATSACAERPELRVVDDPLHRCACYHPLTS
jgi:oligopeptide transport system ATP-binding protein